MALTPRFGFLRVGGAAGGAITDRGFQFTNADRLLLDRLLTAMEAHDHGGGARVSDPTAAPTLALDTANGVLPGGKTFYYTTAYVDRYGLETASGPEAAIATPAQVAAPTRPTLTAVTTGGTLTAGLYTYALTFEVGSYETQLGEQNVITLLSDRDTVQLGLPSMPVGADAIAVWRKGPNDNGFTKIGTSTATTIQDDGTVPSDPCACDPDKLPPTENLTNSTNAVTVTLPNASFVHDAANGIERWRVYRATSSGGYGAKSLVAEIADLDGSGLLVTEYVDYGANAADGQPKSQSQTLIPSVGIGGGTSGVVGEGLIKDSGGTIWALTATLDGQIVSTAQPQSIATVYEGFSLTDSLGSEWRVTIGTDGILVTTDAAAAAGETSYSADDGPFLRTVDGSVSYQLDVETDGRLITHGDAANAGYVRLPERTEPDTPTSGGVLWVGTDGALNFKGKDGTNTVLVPA